MSDDKAVEKAQRVEIVEARLDIKLDATISLRDSNGEMHWVKPAVQSGMTWNGLPTEREMQVATKYITGAIIEPSLSEIVGTIMKNEALRAVQPEQKS